MLALLAVALGAAPVSLAMPGLNPVNIGAAEAEFHAETLAGDLMALHFKVQTSRDIVTALGLQRQKELLGCNETGCFTELAGALGADGIVVGDVGRIGSEYALNVKVLKPDGSVLALFNARIDKPEDVRAALADAARSLAHQLAQVLARPELEPPVVEKPKPPPPQPSRRIFALVPAALAVVGFGVGAGLQVGAGDQWNALMNATYDKAARDAHDTGKSLELGGNIALAVGAVALVAAVVWFFYAGPGEAAP